MAVFGQGENLVANLITCGGSYLTFLHDDQGHLLGCHLVRRNGIGVELSILASVNARAQHLAPPDDVANVFQVKL